MPKVVVTVYGITLKGEASEKQVESLKEFLFKGNRPSNVTLTIKREQDERNPYLARELSRQREEASGKPEG